jgi:tetratricopeptide (TPR) repeat protein
MFKNKVNLVLLVLAALMFAACGQKPAKTEAQYMDEAKAKLDAQQYPEAIALYKELIAAYPQSPQAKTAYDQIAGIYIDRMQNYQEGINTYKEMANKYPGTKEGKRSLFMVAFTYDEKLNDKPKAIETYKEFLVKYPKDEGPDDKMSSDAKAMIEMYESGKTIEQMIEENIKKSAGDNTKKDTTNPKEQPKLTPETKPGDSDNPPKK